MFILCYLLRKDFRNPKFWITPPIFPLSAIWNNSTEDYVMSKASILYIKVWLGDWRKEETPVLVVFDVTDISVWMEALEAGLERGKGKHLILMNPCLIIMMAIYWMSITALCSWCKIEKSSEVMIPLYTEHHLYVQPVRCRKFVPVTLKLIVATYSSSFIYSMLEPGFKVGLTDFKAKVKHIWEQPFSPHLSLQLFCLLKL